MRTIVAFFLAFTLWQTTANAQEVWKITGWRVDRNAAIAGQYGDNIDGIGVNFPKQQDIARFVICSSAQAVRNDPYVNVRGMIDDGYDSAFVGRLDKIKGNPYCWRGSLDKSTLSSIKRGRVLVLAIDKAVLMVVDLQGSSDAMDRAWQNTLEMRYSDALKREERAIKSWIMRGLMDY
jgi:hypothetical protein